MKRLLSLVLLPVILIATACGGDGSPDPAASASPSASTVASPSASPSSSPTATDQALIVANSTGAYLSLVNPATGEIVDHLQVGPAPHRIVAAGDIGFVTTATDLVIFNLRSGEILARLPYQTPIGPASEGEFREGGMGLAVAPDGQHVFVGVYSKNGSFLEVFHTRNGYERSIPIGGRPLDVLVAPDGKTVYAIGHDDFTLTAVDTQTWEPRTVEVAPLGRGESDKPAYGAIAGDELLLPFQGRTLLAYNLTTGAQRQVPLSANTGQHGIAVTHDGKHALIVGTGPSGDAAGAPSLTILTLADGSERVVPLSKPRELVAVSPDDGTAYLTGGYGSDDLTVVDLASGATREIALLDRPLGIVVLGPRK